MRQALELTLVQVQVGNGLKLLMQLRHSHLHLIGLNFTTTFTSGDTITYFFTAQDNVSTPNVGINSAILIPSTSCPTSVDIGATSGISDATSPYRFVFGAIPYDFF